MLRRNFLKTLGLGTAALAAVPVIAIQPEEVNEPGPDKYPLQNPCEVFPPCRERLTRLDFIAKLDGKQFHFTRTRSTGEIEDDEILTPTNPVNLNTYSSIRLVCIHCYDDNDFFYENPDGTFIAQIKTPSGNVYCDRFEPRASPVTYANFSSPVTYANFSKGHFVQQGTVFHANVLYPGGIHAQTFSWLAQKDVYVLGIRMPGGTLIVGDHLGITRDPQCRLATSKEFTREKGYITIHEDNLELLDAQTH